MTRNRRIATLSLVLSGALLASACGGGGFEEDAGSSAPASASRCIESRSVSVPVIRSSRNPARSVRLVPAAGCTATLLPP